MDLSTTLGTVCLQQSSQLPIKASFFMAGELCGSVLGDGDAQCQQQCKAEQG